MNSPLVSVIVPTYNRDYCITRAVDSALAQTWPSIEVIVLDDGSTDRTSEVLSRRYGADSRVRYIWQSNTGVSIARNTALKASRGDYIALLDSDDEWVPWKIDLQVACMRARPDVGMTWTDMDAVDAEGTVVHAKYLRRMYNAYRWYPTNDLLFSQRMRLSEIAPELGSVVAGHDFYEGDLSSAIVMGSLVHTSTVVLTRERLEKVGPFSSDYRNAGEDYEFYVRTCRAGLVGFADVATVKYQLGLADQLTNSKHNIDFAVSFLRTIGPIIDKDRSRLKLSPRMIDDVLCSAHRWVGEASLDVGDRRAAMRHLATSIRIHPWQPRSIALLLAATLPARIRTAASATLSQIKTRVQGLPIPRRPNN
jgi:glycosyltransferase involved in cell wall biosynthesis